MENKCPMCSPKILLLVLLFAFFFFAAAHFYLASFSLPTTSISHFLTAGRYKIFVFPAKFVSFVFYLSLFLCFSAYPDILENGEKISVFKHIRIQVDTA